MKDHPPPTPDAPAPLDIEIRGMTKRFGPVAALDAVDAHFKAGTLHALLGENGAGKSTLVKCLMGFYRADAGEVRIDGAAARIANPNMARRAGVGMVYQHFTLVPSMTVAENLALAEGDLPLVLDWRARRDALAAFMAETPFQIDLDRPVSALAAGEKQKLEILKQLHIGSRFLILDEPTSVLTPGEADEILGLMRRYTEENRLTAVLITHKLREVEAFADEVTVLRGGRLSGGGRVGALTRADMVRLMIGARAIATSQLGAPPASKAIALELQNLRVRDDKGVSAVDDLSLRVRAGEIVGVAGVSGNGQRELVEALAGQREREGGEILVDGETYSGARAQKRDLGVNILPEDPLNNACVSTMSVAENLAIGAFDRPPARRWGGFIDRGAIRRAATALIEQFRIKTPGPDAPIRTLSGGNVQRTVLARELSGDAKLLIVQNPCFGLDLSAVAEIRKRIVDARNAGAGVLLVSEDLDEILELSDRILVMFEGRLAFETPRAEADLAEIGRHMASSA